MSTVLLRKERVEGVASEVDVHVVLAATLSYLLSATGLALLVLCITTSLPLSPHWWSRTGSRKTFNLLSGQNYHKRFIAL